MNVLVWGRVRNCDVECKKIEMREKKERGGGDISHEVRVAYSCATQRNRVKKREVDKKKKFSCWWTARDRSIFPSVWLSAQSQSIQYKSLRGSILVYNNMVSLWCSYRWQALITTWLWSARTINTSQVVQCYLVVTLVTYFKCHVPARLEIGHHGCRGQGGKSFTDRYCHIFPPGWTTLGLRFEPVTCCYIMWSLRRDTITCNTSSLISHNKSSVHALLYLQSYSGNTTTNLGIN